MTDYWLFAIALVTGLSGYTLMLVCGRISEHLRGIRKQLERISAAMEKASAASTGGGSKK